MIRKPVWPVLMLLLLTSCAENEEAAGFPWWGWLIIILLLALIVWFLFRDKPATQLKTPPPAEEKMDTSVKAEAVFEAPAGEALLPDDLTLIEGIGPKINEILHAAGVNTFSDLAAMQAEKIKEILTGAGLRLADTTSWPQQAQLAADGEMEKLQVFAGFAQRRPRRLVCQMCFQSRKSVIPAANPGPVLVVL